MKQVHNVPVMRTQRHELRPAQWANTALGGANMHASPALQASWKTNLGLQRVGFKLRPSKHQWEDFLEAGSLTYWTEWWTKG